MRATSRTDTPAASRRALVLGYDELGRRVSQTVSNYVSGAWQLAAQRQFVYAGWNLVAVLDGQGNLRQSFGWGTDQSGTWQGAGGVGGLLWLRDHTQEPAATYYSVADGHGNVVGLVNAADGTVAAQYEYGPFGEGLRATGPLARANPFRFSTKYFDEETGLVYYGFRYYHPATGRWLSPDPLGEAGGLNLYGFSGNDPVNTVDPFGLTNLPGDFGWGWYSVPKTTFRWNVYINLSAMPEVTTLPSTLPKGGALVRTSGTELRPASGYEIPCTVYQPRDPNFYQALIIGASHWENSWMGEQLAAANAVEYLSAPGMSMIGEYVTRLLSARVAVVDCPTPAKTPAQMWEEAMAQAQAPAVPGQDCRRTAGGGGDLRSPGGPKP